MKLLRRKTLPLRKEREPAFDKVQKEKRNPPILVPWSTSPDVSVSNGSIHELCASLPLRERAFYLFWTDLCGGM